VRTLAESNSRGKWSANRALVAYLFPAAAVAAGVVAAACWSMFNAYFLPAKKTFVSDFEPSSSLLVE